MWPGVQENQDFGQFKAQGIFAICNSDDKIIGIGEMVGDHTMPRVDGEACFTLIWKNDKLWEFYNTKDDIKQEYPYLEEEEDEEIDLSAFVKGAKKPQKPNKQEVKQEVKQVKQEEDEDEENDDQEDLNTMIKNKNKKNLQKVEKTEDKKAEKLELEDDAFDKKGKGKKAKKPVQNQKKEIHYEEHKKQEEETQGAIPVHQMDQYLKEAFLNALKLSILDKQIPIDSSQVYSTHMMNCKPPGINIDIRNSSYKKLGKFFQTMDKEGYIDYKEPKKNAAAMISAVHRGFNAFSNYEPTITEVAKKKDKDDGKQDNKSDFNINKIEELYKHKSILDPILGKLADKDYELSSDIKNKINDYIKENLKQEKKAYLLNDYLKELAPKEDEVEIAVDNNDEENQETEEKPKQKKIQSTFTKEDIWNIIQKHVQPYYKITPADKDKKVKVLAGPFKGVKIIAEKVHNKNVTKVSGIDSFGFGLDLDQLQQIWIKQFACAVSQHEVPGNINYNIGGKKLEKDKEKEIHVHGNFLTELKDELVNEYKIPERFVTIQDKLTKKKEKGFQV